MTTNLPTYSNIRDFEQVAARIKRANGTNFELMQTASVAMVRHFAEHHNTSILKPLAEAAASFKSKSLAKRWRAWVCKFANVIYNPENLTGAALSKAPYQKLWVYDRSRQCDVDAATAKHWWTMELTQAESTAPVAIEDLAKRFAKQVQDMVNSKRLTVEGKKGASLATIRRMVTVALEGLEEPKKATKRPAPVKQATKPVTEKVNVPRKRKAAKPVEVQPVETKAAA